MYEMDQGKLPKTLSNLVEPDGSKTWIGQYLEDAVPSDSWGNQIQYTVLSERTFKLRSFGPDGINGTTDDIESTNDTSTLR